MTKKLMLPEKLTQRLLAYLFESVDNKSEIDKPSAAEWDVLLRFAEINGVAPLLYKRLNNSGAKVPKQVLTTLRDAYYHNAFKNAQYYQELYEVLKRLQADGIDVIVLKGAFLAKTVYKSEAFRIIGDMDLLVREADLSKTEKILLDMEYGPKERPSIKQQCANHHHLLPFTKKGAFTIDIHWTLHFTKKHPCPFKINVESLWEQAQPFMVKDIQVLSLSPENLLFHLCLHTAYANNFISMRFLCDLDYTIRYYQDQINWELLFERAQQWKAAKPVYLTLYLLKTRLATPVPEKVLTLFKPSDFNLEFISKTNKIINSNIYNQLWSLDISALFQNNKKLLSNLLILFKRIFPPPEFLADMYHVDKKSLSIYFYYLKHIKYFLAKYSGIISHRSPYEDNIPYQENRISMLKDWMEDV